MTDSFAVMTIIGFAVSHKKSANSRDAIMIAKTSSE